MASKLSTLISALTGKTTPVDADKIPILDSENSFNHNWLSFTQLKVYLALLYAPLAKGVTNGDSHDHNGGDGAKISYANLSNLPTLGTAAATAITDYAAASHAHAASAITSGTVDTARLGSGTANSGTYLRGDQTWAAAAGGVAADTHAATSKPTPVAADELALVDSADSYALKKLTWANLTATLLADPVLVQARLLSSKTFGAL